MRRSIECLCRSSASGSKYEMKKISRNPTLNHLIELATKPRDECEREKEPDEDLWQLQTQEITFLSVHACGMRGGPSQQARVYFYLHFKHITKYYIKSFKFSFFITFNKDSLESYLECENSCFRYKLPILPLE